MTYHIGIDPGLNGAIAFVSRHDVHVFDMPTCEYKLKSGTVRKEIDVKRLYKILCRHESNNATLELVNAMPGDGNVSSFSFGQAYGMTKAGLALACIPYDLVTPQTWKKFYGIKKDKSLSRAKATELFPKHKDIWARKKDDGRAEAILIANYGLAKSGLF